MKEFVVATEVFSTKAQANILGSVENISTAASGQRLAEAVLADRKVEVVTVFDLNDGAVLGEAHRPYYR